MRSFSFILLPLLLVCQLAVAQVKPATTVSPTPAAPAPANVTPAEVDLPKTTIEWLESEFQFGTIKQGDKVEHVFKFKNTGKNPLVIKSAKGSCGCTVPEYSKEALAPGKTGEMKVIFNSAGKMGQQSKPVTIIANTEPEQTRVTLNGMVEQPAGTPAPPVQAANPAADHKHPHPHEAATPATPATPAKPNKVVANAKTDKSQAPKATTTAVSKATKQVEKATEKAEKASVKADKASEKAEKVALKAKKATEKAAKKAEKAAEKAKKAAEKAAKKAKKLEQAAVKAK
jgi:hypothetical protein